MAKEGSRFSILDLGGGFNVLNSPNNIQDKQGVSAVNFNTEGNKLVSSKGYIEVLNFNPTIGGATGFTIDDNTGVKYIVQDGKLWIDGVEFAGTGAALIKDKSYNITIFDTFVIFTNNTENLTVYHTDTSIIDQPATGTLTGKPSVSVVYQGKLLVGGVPEAGNVLYFSKTYDVATPSLLFDFGAYNAGSQVVGNNTNITGFMVGDRELFVFKENETLGTSSSFDNGTAFAFVFEPITNKGSIGQKVITEVDQDTFFYDGRKVRRLAYEENLTTLRDDAISKEIQPLLDSMPEDQSLAVSGFKYPNYKLVLRSEFSGSPDTVFLYNVINKSWYTQFGLSASQMYKGFFTSVYSGVVYEDDITQSFDEGPIVGEFLSKEYTSGDDINNKRYLEFNITGVATPGFVFDVDIYVEGEFVDTLNVTMPEIISKTTGSTTSGVTTSGASGPQNTKPVRFAKKLDLFNEGSNISFKIRYNGIGRLEVYYINIIRKFLIGYATHN